MDSIKNNITDTKDNINLIKKTIEDTKKIMNKLHNDLVMETDLEKIKEAKLKKMKDELKQKINKNK